MTTSRPPRVAQFLTALAIRRPWALVIAAGLAAMLSLWVAATRLEFRFGHTDLVSASDRYRQLDERDRLEFEEVPGRVVVVVRANDPEQAKAFAAALAAKWADDPKIERALYRIDLAPLKAKALWYLSPAELAALHERLAAHQERLHTLAGASTLDDLLARLNREVTSALIGRVFTGFLDDDDKEEQAPPDLTLVLSLLREMNRWLDGTRTYQSPWMAALGGTTPLPSPDGFLWSDDQWLLFVLANPRRETTEFNRFATAVEGIRADVRDLQRSYPGIEVGLTGRAVIEADEMAVAQRDMALATIVAVLGVAGLFVAFFRGLVRPALATITLILGVCWSLGVTTLTIGHLNILTIVFMPMLVGLGDHSIHFIARFEEERRAGRSLWEALECTLAGTGMGIVAATGTTALAFAMLLMTGFKGLMELGVISASGILLTAGATLTVLPALLVLGERWRPAPERQPVSRARTAAPGWLLRHPRVTLAATGLLVALSLVGLRGVRFDFSLLQLQAHETEAIGWAQRVAEHTKRSVLFDEIVASSLEEVRAKVAALQALPSVAEVDSIVSVLPDSPAEKRDLIRELRPLVATLPVPVANPGVVDLPALRAALERIRFKMVEGDATGLSPAEERSRRERNEARDLIDKALGTTGRMEPDAAREALARFQSELFRDLAETLRTLKQQPDGEPVSIEDLPPEIRARYVGRSGQYRLFVYPAENVWEFGPLTRFVADVQSVDPDARGTTATTFEYLRVLKEGYTRAAVYAVVAVAVLALLVFRAVVPGLLALVPLTLGATWTLGVMGWLGVPLNAANLLLLPLIVGIGIDNGVYLVHRFRETPDGADEPRPLAPSAAKAITLASLTNIVGFGSLMLSSHRGIFSLGLVVAVGVVCLWVASVTTLPSLLALLVRSRRADRVPRETLRLGRVPAVPREAWAGHTATVRNRPVDSHAAIKGGSS
jgi:hopanoid biosynthesis associated RND transporter like protein HpnN